MCPDCPRCNKCAFGCQDKFGNNMRPGGGVLGGMPAIGGATEDQGYGTPHLHVEGHVASAYKYDTLAEIVEKLKAGFFSYSDLVNYHEWLHTEDVVDEAVREEMQPTLEEEWHTRFSSPFLGVNMRKVFTKGRFSGSPLRNSAATKNAEF